MAKVIFEYHKDLVVDLQPEFHVDYSDKDKGITYVMQNGVKGSVVYIRRLYNDRLKAISDFEYENEFGKDQTAKRATRNVNTFLGCKAISESFMWVNPNGSKAEMRAYYLSRNEIGYSFWLVPGLDNYQSAKNVVDSMSWTGRFDNRPIPCWDCKSRGFYEGKCNQCNGTGLLPKPVGPRAYSMSPGNMVPCFQCNRKKTVTYKCPTCDGRRFAFRLKP